MDIIRIFVPETCEQEASPVGCSGPVPIGYVGESGVRQVVLDFSPWVEAYGPGALTLMVRRNGDANAYPVTLEIDGSSAAWTVSNIDTHIYGVGRAQYMYVVDGENVKSAIFQTFVDKSVTQPGSDPPDPYEGWVQHLTELGAETLVNAQAAAGSAEAAETAKTEAENAEQGAAESEEDAKAWAVGERNGQPVPSTDPTYHNNAKYYAEQAASNAPVQSVNGKIGAVELDAEDVGALSDSSTLDNIPNGETYARTTPAQVQQIGQNAADIDTLETDVDAIEAKIPTQASAQNQLADKDFVNSSINSAAAYFRGSFPTRAALFAVAWQTSDPTAANFVTNNDYAYVEDDESHDDEAWRYLYVLQPSGQNNGWQPQFKVNDTPLTAAQLAALNSGATAENIASISGKYVKPASGIPASDMAETVRASLNKADTALQSVPNTYRTAAAQDVIDGGKQATLVSGVNIKTINNQSILGGGNIDIHGGGGQNVDDALSLTSENPVQNKAIYAGILKAFPTDTASGAVASFPDGADGLPLKKLVVNIEPVQAGSGDPSPQNVRPIGGYTKCYINNSLSANQIVGTPQNITYLQDQQITIQSNTHLMYTNSIGEPTKIFVHCLPFYTHLNGGYEYLMFMFQKDGTFITSTEWLTNEYTYIQNSSKADYVYIVIRKTSNTAIDVNENTGIGIYLNSDYIHTMPSGYQNVISWQATASTVYGGALTINEDGTGELVVDSVKAVFDGTETFTSTGGYFVHTLDSRNIADADNAISSHLPENPSIGSNNNLTGFRWYYRNSPPSGSNILIRFDRNQSSSDFRAYLAEQYAAGTPFTVVGKLLPAYAQSYQLTVEQVTTLLGTNNIWADCGEVSVEYRADTKLYIQKINAPADDDMTADAQIASGKYFIVGGNLYLSTTTIPAGDAINPGTNCTQTNLAEALNALNT